MTERKRSCTCCGGRVEVKGQLAGIGSLLPPCRFQGWSFGHQAWWQVPHPLIHPTGAKFIPLNHLLEKKNASNQQLNMFTLEHARGQQTKLKANRIKEMIRKKQNFIEKWEYKNTLANFSTSLLNNLRHIVNYQNQEWKRGWKCLPQWSQDKEEANEKLGVQRHWECRFAGHTAEQFLWWAQL